LAYREVTLKKLFALSGNSCAFPDCPAPLVDDETDIVIGDICHIKARKPDGPRYDASQTNEERNSYENLIAMCKPHHTIIDHEDTRNEYPVERLLKFKEDHEAQYRRKLYDPTWAGDLNWGRVDQRKLNIFLNHFFNRGDANITTHNQSGGQNAFQIVNVYAPLTKAVVAVTPLIESHRTSADKTGQIDYYAFRVRLRNDSEKTIKSFRLEVEIPNGFADPTHLSSMMGRCQIQGDVTVYTHTEAGHPGFVLYPKRTSDLVMNNNYIMRFDQYHDTEGTIAVRVYVDDDLVGSEDFSVRENRNKDRMDQLGLKH